MIIDASALLCAFFPDEAQGAVQGLLREHAAGRRRLQAPMLLIYEMNNAVWQAERRGRISNLQAAEILQAVDGLGIELHAPEWGDSLELARHVGCSVYDATYLALGYKLNQDMLTADKRLFNKLAGKLPWVSLLKG
ncbi:MAG: type II toxin-antitoxin system VapC family toxin [Anaerolineales bacterium]|nr:MAG: type II toxin-antitoxin system VapC family toxin [Anaerolineales bacterium]